MKKYLALATAGAMALAVLAVTANSPQAAWNGNQGQYSKQNSQGNNDWKRRMGGNSSGQWRGQNNSQGSQSESWGGPSKKSAKKWNQSKQFSKDWDKNDWKWKHNNNDWKWKHHHQQHFNPAPFFFGFALGALATPYYYDEGPLYAGLTPHQLWCLRNYPNTYNPTTNTFYVRPGVVAVCISPYSSPFPY